MSVPVLVTAAVVVAVMPLFPLLTIAVIRMSVVPAPLPVLIIIAAIVLFLPLVVPALFTVIGVPVVAMPPVVFVFCVPRPLPRVTVSLL